MRVRFSYSPRSSENIYDIDEPDPPDVTGEGEVVGVYWKPTDGVHMLIWDGSEYHRIPADSCKPIDLIDYNAGRK